MLALHQHLSRSTDAEEFREVVDLFRHELRKLAEYRSGKSGKPLASARLLIAALDVNTDRSPEVIEDLFSHPVLRSSLNVNCQQPDHQRVMARAMTHPSTSGKVPDNLISEAAALREASMDSSAAALFFTTDAETLLREADNFEHKTERYSLGQVTALNDALAQGKDIRYWERLREFPWNFRPDHWGLITATAAKALNLSEEVLAEASASWRPNPPLLGKNEASRWQVRKTEERNRLVGAYDADHTKSFVVGNDPHLYIEKLKAASTVEELRDIWKSPGRTQPSVVPAFIAALLSNRNASVELAVEIIQEAQYSATVDERSAVARALSDASTNQQWSLEGLPLSDDFLNRHLMTLTLAVRKAESPQYIENLWRYVSHYYFESSNPMRLKVFDAFVKNKCTPKVVKAEAEAALRTPTRQDSLEVRP